MFDKKEVKIMTNLDDLLLMFGCALRYSLRRRTYVTSTTSDFIIDNIELLNEKWCVNMLRDIVEYERDRIEWGEKYKDDTSMGKLDDDCDYVSWMNLKEKILEHHSKIGGDIEVLNRRLVQ
jgi:triacylglycerol esterase/lipase EstA (alpha/beta hydrolase family)